MDFPNESVWTESLNQLLRVRRAQTPLPGQAISSLIPRPVDSARHVPAMLAYRAVGLTAVLANRDHIEPDQPITNLWMKLGKLQWREPDASRYGTHVSPGQPLEFWTSTKY